MRKSILSLAAGASFAVLGASSASAFPVAPLGEIASPVEQVRLVCDRWGRCWRTGPRFYRHGYYGPRRYWGPGYGYYGPRYGYYGGPRYGYYGGPGFRFGGPGFAFRFGF